LQRSKQSNDTKDHVRFLSAIFADIPAPELKWEEMESAPVPRLDGYSVQINNLLYVFSGYGSLDYVRNLRMIITWLVLKMVLMITWLFCLRLILMWMCSISQTISGVTDSTLLKKWRIRTSGLWRMDGMYMWFQGSLVHNVEDLLLVPLF